MQLKKLSLTNFRNIASLELTFGTLATAFVGQNGQGKTNTLEAIHLLALGKSLRTAEERELIRQGSDFFRIAAELTSGDTQVTLELAYTRAGEKRCKVDGKQVAVGDFIGHFFVVAFFPEDLNFILLTPSVRRRYLDALLSSLSHTYLLALARYTKALRQRNALLLRIREGFANEAELHFWDQELARHGCVVGQLRVELLAEIAPRLATRYRAISLTNRELTLTLKNFHAQDLTVEKFIENLAKLRSEDVKYGVTNYGPHRADLSFALDGMPLASSGSRGEIRSAMLALKFAELTIIEERHHTRPIFLLDDVYSELDRGRQTQLMCEIATHQTFITTTKLEHLDAVQDKKVWQMDAGVVRPL